VQSEERKCRRSCQQVNSGEQNPVTVGGGVVLEANLSGIPGVLVLVWRSGREATIFFSLNLKRASLERGWGSTVGKRRNDLGK
jgi:hypothetical protein